MWWFACEKPASDGYLPIPISVDGPIEHLIVTTVTGDILLEHTDEELVSGELVVLADDDDFSQTEFDGVLTLSATCANREAGCSGAFALAVPPGLTIETHTVDGDLHLDGLRDQNITHDATTGDVYGDRLGRANTVVATTTSGRHDVAFRSEPDALTLTAHTGNVEATVPAGLYAVELIAGGQTTVTGVTEDPAGPLLRLSSQEGDVTLIGVLDTE